MRRFKPVRTESIPKAIGKMLSAIATEATSTPLAWNAHAASEDFVARNRPVGFNHVCMKRGVIQKRLPYTHSGAAPYDLVSQTRRLNVEALRKIGF